MSAIQVSISNRSEIRVFKKIFRKRMNKVIVELVTPASHDRERLSLSLMP